VGSLVGAVGLFIGSAVAVTTIHENVAVQPAYAAPSQADLDSLPLIFEEDFGTGSRYVNIENYTRSDNVRYTASNFWKSGYSSNGIIGGKGTNWDPTDNSMNNTPGLIDLVHALAVLLGQIDGRGNPDTNRVLTLFSGAPTSPPPQPNEIMLETRSNTPITTSPNRFVTLGVDAASTTIVEPIYRFYITDASGERMLGSVVRPYTNRQKSGPYVLDTYTGGGRFIADKAMLVNGSQFGIRMRNEQAVSSGNDGVIDNIRVYDVTPGIGAYSSQTTSSGTKFISYPTGGMSFATTRLKQGETTKLTLTVGNSKEKSEKNGWSFKVDLPTGLKVAPTPGIGGTCRTSPHAATVNATANATSVSITNGKLGNNTESCTIEFNVTNKDTTDSVQKLTLDKTAFKGVSGADPVGMNRPADSATVTFIPTPTLKLAGSSTFTNNTRPGETFTNTITGTNTSGSYSYTTSNPNNPAIIGRL
jgi:hypothetical protein